MITKLNLFGPVTSETDAPIVLAKADQPQHAGWHRALDWAATDVLFFGFWCDKCHNRCVTPLLKDVGRAYVCVVRHCGREERVTIGELLAANLPTVRTEPAHHKNVNVIGDTRVMQVGDFGDDDNGIKYDGVNAGPKDTENPEAQLDGGLWGGGR